MRRECGNCCLELSCARSISVFFFFNDTATTEIYPLSLHDALPIYLGELGDASTIARATPVPVAGGLTFATINVGLFQDRKSTRLNSSHSQISYAVFCLKKKKRILALSARVPQAADPSHRRDQAGPL